MTHKWTNATRTLKAIGAFRPIDVNSKVATGNFSVPSAGNDWEDIKGTPCSDGTQTTTQADTFTHDKFHRFSIQIDEHKSPLGTTGRWTNAISIIFDRENIRFLQYRYYEGELENHFQIRNNQRFIKLFMTYVLNNYLFPSDLYRRLGGIVSVVVYWASDVKIQKMTFYDCPPRTVFSLSIASTVDILHNVTMLLLVKIHSCTCQP